MANRYWVLGSGTWDATTTTNWSATSGGTGGASAPTSADDVIFNNLSGAAPTVTIGTNATCGAVTITAPTSGTLTFAFSTTGNLNFSGNWSNPSTLFACTGAGNTGINYVGSTSSTFTTNGISFPTTVIVNGTGTLTLGSAFTTTVSFTVTQGTFSTSASNYSLSAALLSSSNTNTRTISLNASTVTLSLATPVNFSTSTNLTFNAGTSTINCSSSTGTFVGGGQTFYNVAFTSTALTSPSITGANTFNNLSITGRTTVGIGVLSLSANQTINGTFTVSAGTASAYRMQVSSDTIGTTRTLTCAAISLTDTDFRDITISGAASPASGTRLGDCKGNSGITFPAAKTVYYGQTGSANWATTGTGSWSASSGGSLDATQFPLAQDTAIFPAATYPASGIAATINANYNIGTIDMSLRTSNTMTLATGSTTPFIYGNWINGTGITLSGTGTLTFSGRTTQQITSSSVTFTQPISINSPSGSVTLQDALTTGTGITTTLTNGTLALQSFKLSTGLFNSNNPNTRTIAFGTGNIECTSTGTVWTTATVTGLTTTGTQVVNITSTGSTAITVNSGALSEANSISFNFTGGTYGLDFLATAQTARNVDFTGYAGNWTGPFSAVINIYGNFKLSSGMTLSASAFALIFAGTSGTQQITTNAKTLDFPLNFNGVGGAFQLQDALTTGSSRNTSLGNGTLDLNGKTLTVGLSFNIATGTKNLTFNGGTLVCPTAATTAFNNAQPTNFTTTAGTGTGTISMTAATAKTFVGGGSTFNCTLQNAGAGALTITGSNTFTSISNSVQPTTFTFTAGTTTTVTNWNVNGTAGNLVTIGSATAASHTLSKASGTVSSDYLSISRSTATGGASWYAGANSTNGGNNSGWIFTAPPSVTATGNFLVFF